MLWLTTSCYGCYFLRAVIVTSVTKMHALLRNATNEQNKLNSANSPNSLTSILTFLPCQYTLTEAIVCLQNYLQRMLWLTMDCYGCYFLRTIVVSPVTKMYCCEMRQTIEQNELDSTNSLNSIFTFLLCQYHWTTFKSFYGRNAVFITSDVTIFTFSTRKHTINKILTCQDVKHNVRLFCYEFLYKYLMLWTLLR